MIFAFKGRESLLIPFEVRKFHPVVSPHPPNAVRRSSLCNGVTAGGVGATQQRRGGRREAACAPQAGHDHHGLAELLLECVALLLHLVEFGLVGLPQRFRRRRHRLLLRVGGGGLLLRCAVDSGRVQAHAGRSRLRARGLLRQCHRAGDFGREGQLRSHPLRPQHAYVASVRPQSRRLRRLLSMSQAPTSTVGNASPESRQAPISAERLHDESTAYPSVMPPWGAASSQPIYSDAKVANRNVRDVGWEIAHTPFRDARRFPSTRWYPVPKLRVRRWGFGFVHRSRTIFCRPVPNPNRYDSQLFLSLCTVAAGTLTPGEWRRGRERTTTGEPGTCGDDAPEVPGVTPLNLSCSLPQSTARRMVCARRLLSSTSLAELSFAAASSCLFILARSCSNRRTCRRAESSSAVRATTQSARQQGC
jgi:hypothetical protein